MSKGLTDRHLKTALHGTRARYVQGCRCRPCAAANLAAYHQRERRDKAALARLPAPAGRTCPGVFGRPCEAQTKLRKDSGPVCRLCRRRFSYDGLIDATAVRAHLRSLQRRGVGLRSIRHVTGCSRTVLQGLRDGTRNRVRASVARRILDADLVRCLAYSAGRYRGRPGTTQAKPEV